MVRTVVCLLTFFLSSFGYWEFFRKKTNMSVYFLPFFTVTVEFSILFLAGLLNVMAEAALGLYALGILLLVYHVRTDGLQVIRPYWSWGHLLFAVILGLYIITIRGKVLYGEDDFAHWGIAVKKMLETSRMPNFTDEVISFRKYPLGSSLWIWFFCYFLGDQEDVMLLAQGYMLLCCLFPWFYVVSRNKLMSTAVAMIGVSVVLCYNIGIHSLMVDTLLPLAGMAALFFVFCQRGKDFRDFLPAVPMLIWVSQIKNSGLLFAVLGSVLLICSGKRKAGQLAARTACAAAPLAAFLLWSRHCDLVFSDASQTKHAVSVENYAVILGLKTDEEIRTILTNVTEYVLKRDGLQLALVWILILGAVTLLLLRGYKKEYFLLCAACGVLSVVYYVGICGMYLFSMPTYEAMMLAAIERYMRTLDIALMYLMMLYSLRLMSAAGGTRMTGLCCAAVVCLSFWWLQSPYRLDRIFHFGQYTVERDMFTGLLKGYGVQPGGSYMICADGYGGLYYFMCCYMLDRVPLCLDVEEVQQMDAAADYDVLINLDTENPIIQDWIARNYPDHQGEQIIYMFD